MSLPRPHRPHGARAPGVAAITAITAITLFVGTIPRLADAAPVAAPAKEPPPPPEATEFYQQAMRSRSQGHHSIAADLFVAAFKRLDTPEGRTTWPQARGTVMANIYDELLLAYNQDGDLRHLCGLLGHLAAYVETLDPAQTKVVSDKLASVALKITAKSGKAVEPSCAALNPAPAPATVPAPPSEPVEPAPPTRTTPTPTPQEPAPAAESPVDDASEHQRRVMTISGGVLVGVGTLSLGVMTGALVRGDQIVETLDAKTQELKDEMRPATDQERADAAEADRQGQRANAIAWATGVSGVALLGAGIALLATAGKKRERHLSVSPAIAPTSLGASVHLRF